MSIGIKVGKEQVLTEYSYHIELPEGGVYDLTAHGTDPHNGMEVLVIQLTKVIETLKDSIAKNKV